MRASRLLTTLLLVPATAFAQESALEQAHQAEAVEQAGTQAHQSAADEQLRQGEIEAEAPAAAPEPAASTAAPAIDLGRAAAKLERGEEEGAIEEEKSSSTGTAPETYRVRRGDTLWDLSGRFLNNPWYWPKVWSYNPEISNPHFIYPGNVLRFFPGGEGGAARLEVAESGEVSSPKELGDLSRADMKKPQEIGDDDEVRVVGPYKIGYVAPRGVRARRDTFVTAHELAESGVLYAGFHDKVMLSLQDTAYARFKVPGKVRVGETYVIYKTLRPVQHPVTHETFGYQSIIIGTGKVQAIGDKAATIEIVQAFDGIERGAMLGPWQEKLLKQVARRPNQRELTGFIIAAQQESLSELGEHHVVFLDKGRNDGVEEGNVFTVIRAGDPLGRSQREIQRDARLPTEVVGSLLVTDVQPTSSTAVILKSMRELFVGDKVEMHVTSSGATAGVAAVGAPLVKAH